MMTLFSSLISAQEYEGIWQDTRDKNVIMVIDKIDYNTFKIINHDLDNQIFTEETFLNSYNGMTTYYKDLVEDVSYELNYLIINNKMHCYNELELTNVYKKINK